jgi:hypothetical protein
MEVGTEGKEDAEIFLAVLSSFLQGSEECGEGGERATVGWI